MSLIYRIKRLVKSDLHAFVEGMEEKKWILAQAIRDMEEELEKMAKEIEYKKNTLAQLNEQVQSSEASARKIETDIDFAMKEKREDISKNLIKKLLLTQKNLERLKKEAALTSQEVEQKEKEYLEKKHSYEEVCTRAETLHLEKIGEDVFGAASRLVPEDTSLNHQVELEFLRRLQKQKETRHEN